MPVSSLNITLYAQFFFITDEFYGLKEFTTIPNSRLKTLNEHKYDLGGIEVLKLASIYGANGAGKSNLVKSLFLFQKMILAKEIPFQMKDTHFKFTDRKEQTFGVEFVQDGTPLYYAMVLSENIILTEELYLSGLGQKEDQLIFERKTLGKETQLTFLSEFEQDEKSKVLKEVLLDFIEPNEPMLELLSNRENKFLKDVKKAYEWFAETLEVLTPDSKPGAFAYKIDIGLDFKKYAEDLMGSFNIGVKSLSTERRTIREFFGEDNENELDKIIKDLEKSPI